jgi:single-stranded DNA-binding protein
MSSDMEVALTGVCAREPELKQSKAGKRYATFSLGVGEGDARQWVRVTCFAESAEKVAQQLRKGQKAYIEGSLELGIWQPDGRPPALNINVAARRVEVLGRIGRNRPKRDRGGHEYAFHEEMPMSRASKSGSFQPLHRRERDPLGRPRLILVSGQPAQGRAKAITMHGRTHGHLRSAKAGGNLRHRQAIGDQGDQLEAQVWGGPTMGGHGRSPGVRGGEHMGQRRGNTTSAPGQWASERDAA